jgi:hypothetical protein
MVACGNLPAGIIRRFPIPSGIISVGTRYQQTNKSFYEQPDEALKIDLHILDVDQTHRILLPRFDPNVHRKIDIRLQPKKTPLPNIGAIIPDSIPLSHYAQQHLRAYLPLTHFP